MSEAPLWLTEAQVVALVDMAAAVAAVEGAVGREARGEAMPMPKTFVRFAPETSLQALGAALPGAGLAGTKTWVQARPGHPQPLVVLFDGADGRLRAVIEASALGQLRTGAAAGAATRRLAPPDADEMAIIGSGRQALAQLVAVAAVRTLRRLSVHSPTATHRERFAERIRAELGIEARAFASVAEAVRDCPIVTLATSASRPVLSSAMVAPGAHINAIGATVPNKAEFDTDIFPRCAIVCTDSLDGVRALSDEFRAYYGAGPGGWSAVKSLGALVAEGVGRPTGADLTLYKGVGSGVLDLALAAAAFERARRQGVGLELPVRRPAAIPLGGQERTA